MKPVKKYES